jgi:hypothetical protein
MQELLRQLLLLPRSPAHEAIPVDPNDGAEAVAEADEEPADSMPDESMPDEPTPYEELLDELTGGFEPVIALPPPAIDTVNPAAEFDPKTGLVDRVAGKGKGFSRQEVQQQVDDYWEQLEEDPELLDELERQLQEQEQLQTDE